jgi:hypothetical protein
MRNRKDLSGLKFKMLTVLAFDHSSTTGQSYYKCLCECGKEKIIRSSNFTHGNTISCGCYSKFEKNKWLRTTSPHLLTPKRVWRANYMDGCSFEKFLKLSQQNCYYCESPPSNRSNVYSDRMKKGTISKEWFEKCWWTYNGLDRIDSSQNHNENNIVPCCILCNQAKNNMSVDDFKSWINLIYKNFILKEN